MKSAMFPKSQTVDWDGATRMCPTDGDGAWPGSASCVIRACVAGLRNELYPISLGTVSNHIQAGAGSMAICE